MENAIYLCLSAVLCFFVFFFAFVIKSTRANDPHFLRGVKH